MAQLWNHLDIGFYSSSSEQNWIKASISGQGKEVERPSSPSMTNVPGLRVYINFFGTFRILNLYPSLGQVVGPRPERVYAHKLLLELAKHPLALQWPPYLDQAYKNGRGVWDPDRWHLDRKRGETPEPLERLPGRVREVAREAVAGPGGGGDEDLGQLVLSPQRRSFLSGCAAAPGEPGGEVSLRPEVNLLNPKWLSFKHYSCLVSELVAADCWQGSLRVLLRGDLDSGEGRRGDSRVMRWEEGFSFPGFILQYLLR